MFDDLRCDRALPDGKPGKQFQTKSFDDRGFFYYVITEDGRLVKNDNDIDFHGIVNFYSYDSKTGDWREFDAVFTHGQLETIKVVEVVA